MSKQTVYIAGYEGNNVLATSGWLWFRGKKDADDHYNELKTDIEPAGGIVYHGELEVESVTDEDINNEVEKFLEKNDFDKAFDKK